MAHCTRCGRTLTGFIFGKKICAWCRQHEAAQRGEEIGTQPVMAVPWQRREALPMMVTQAFFGINVAVFIGMILAGVSPMSPSGESLLLWGANYGPYTLSGQWWRLLTSCFVHIGILHIGFNMWCLWSLGGLAERLYGHVTFACVYLLCGISGSLGSIWWHSTPALSAGASGAIFGIAGAVIASLKLGEFSSGSMGSGTMQSLIAFVGFNVIFGAVSGSTDNACHFGGLAAGLVLGALIARFAPDDDLWPRLGILALVAALLAGGGYALQRSRAYPYLLMRASEALQDGNIDAALPFYEDAIKMNPQSANAIRSQLALAYWEKKDLPGAERQLQMVVLADPNDQEALNDLGGIRLEMHRNQEARQSFVQLLMVNPRSAEAHQGLGAVAMAENKPVYALPEFVRASDLNWRLPGIHAMQGECLMRLERYDEAIAAYGKQIEVSGDSASVERSMAEAYQAKGMKAEATAALQRADKLGSGQP